MHLHWLILFLVSLGRVSKTKVCNNTQIVQAKQALLEHLDLDSNKTQNARMWPLIFNNNSYINPAKIYVDLYVTSITNVNEKAQSLTTQVRMITAWPNRNLRWNYGNYCGIETFAVPKNSFWIPDIGIFESIDTEFGTKESPNVLLFHYGFIATYDVLSLTTACKMDLYKYPFDTQSCTITLQSTSYSSQEITFEILTNQLNITFESKTFQAQGEWELLSINCTNATMTKWIEMNQLIYQITIKRRPRLYVINIIVPVFFFLLLDVFSFFIDVNRQDKLNFKVTLLLSISVMLLLVNNTLPSTSEQIPLIGVYCSAIFCLIGISIVETILVHFMMDTGTEKRSEETTAAVTGRDDRVKDQQNPPDSVGNQNEPATRPKKRQNFWTRVARIIDVTFFVLYLITIIVFLSVLGTLWLP